MKLYFKAFTGFGAERSVSFPAEELEKATYAFLREKRVAFKDGQSVDGKFIQQISPDWHRIMGWTADYKLGVNDFAELAQRGVDRAAREFQGKVNERVHYLIANKQENLIGTGTKIPELERPSVERREGKPRPVGELLEKNHPHENTSNKTA